MAYRQRRNSRAGCLHLTVERLLPAAQSSAAWMLRQRSWVWFMPLGPDPFVC